MAQFDMITNDLGRTLDQAFDINDRYFQIDTADHETIKSWLNHNPYIDTFALLDGQVHGFFNLIPITKECGAQFEEQSIREEDLNPECILKHEFLPYAEYAYFAAIAVKDTGRYVSRQCVAAMLSVIASQLLYGYKQGVFRRLFANPTTFSGNEMIRKLGLKPLISIKKPLKANDIYVADMTPEVIEGLKALEARYARFVGVNPWAAKAA